MLRLVVFRVVRVCLCAKELQMPLLLEAGIENALTT